MKFFVDTAVTSEISELNDYGLLDGVTTNPSLIAKSGRDFKEVIAEICEMVDGPVSAEVAALDYDGMVAEADVLAAIADNVVIKLPLTLDGLKTCRYLTAKGVKTNVTLCFSATQALLAAKAGATMVSPFIGPLDDLGHRGMGLIEDIVKTFRSYPRLKTEVLVASIRNADHVRQAALLGADISTIPPKIFDKMVGHDLTDKGLAAFLADWESRAQPVNA